MNSLNRQPYFTLLYSKILGFEGNGSSTDGASDLFAKVLVDKGKHRRAIFGVAHHSPNSPLA